MAKPASEATKAINKKILEVLPFKDKSDLADVRRGIIAEAKDLVIKNDKGDIIWDMKSYYDMVAANPECPDTVNPSYWRHECRETVAGLFEVTDGIWQVRGFDLANLTLIRSDHGYIALDVLSTRETAKAAMDFAFKYLPQKPITGVIVTHSHSDHYNGIDGVVDVKDIESGKIPLIVPDKFTEQVGNEAIFVGRAIRRRIAYQLGHRLPRNPRGNLGTGLGKSMAMGSTNYVKPNIVITRTGETINVDGIDLEFQLTPETEAPAEMCVYIPKYRALCMAELINAHMHNLLPLRGAQARSAKLWSYYLNEALVLFGDRTDVMFITHHWPCWGSENIKKYLKKQRDAYKFINDQTIRMVNHGQTMVEIAEDLELPGALGKEWFNRGYYGYLNHNVKATYQRYLGWFDCNPSNLNALPPEEAGRHYVEFMGGVEETLCKATESMAKGEYRWAAMVLNHVVFGFPNNERAKDLLADAYEQLGYQAECGTWRNCYLNGAMELREGLPAPNHLSTIGKSTINNMNTVLLLDYLATRVDPEKADGLNININISFTDTDETWNWSLENSVMNYWPKEVADGQAQYDMSRKTFNAIANGDTSVDQAIASGEIKETGKNGSLASMFGVLEEYPDFFFGVVTP